MGLGKKSGGGPHVGQVDCPSKLVSPYIITRIYIYYNPSRTRRRIRSQVGNITCRGKKIRRGSPCRTVSRSQSINIEYEQITLPIISKSVKTKSNNDSRFTVAEIESIRTQKGYLFKKETLRKITDHQSSVKSNSFCGKVCMQQADSLVRCLASLYVEEKVRDMASLFQRGFANEKVTIIAGNKSVDLLWQTSKLLYGLPLTYRIEVTACEF